MLFWLLLLILRDGSTLNVGKQEGADNNTVEAPLGASCPTNFKTNGRALTRNTTIGKETHFRTKGFSLVSVICIF